MPKLTILCPDPCRDERLEALAGHYLRLASRILAVERVHYSASPIKEGSKEQINRALLAEKDRIEKLLPSSAKVLLMSEKGRCLDTMKLHLAFENWLFRARGGLYFVFGGAHGLHQELFTKEREVIGLSPLTFTHELSLVVFLEQLYRLLTIKSGKRYHY